MLTPVIASGHAPGDEFHPAADPRQLILGIRPRRHQEMPDSAIFKFRHLPLRTQSTTLISRDRLVYDVEAFSPVGTANFVGTLQLRCTRCCQLLQYVGSFIHIWRFLTDEPCKHELPLGTVSTTSFCAGPSKQGSDL